MSALFTTPIDARTRFCAVFGYPVRHSASPAMQNAGLAALGLNWRYLAFEVEPGQLSTAIAGAQSMGFVGLNLTVPHKVLALEQVSELDESARTWGAVNTILFLGRQGPSHPWKIASEFETAPTETWSRGYNTDADAIARALHEDLGLRLDGSRVVLAGAGGAGRTAALKLAAEGVAELYLVNRTMAKAEQLAAEIVARYPRIRLRAGYPSGRVDLFVNATPLGLRQDDALPFDTAQFQLSQVGAVYDMIYRPALTPLLAAAQRTGCPAANGLGMLLYQGAKALEIWTGQPAPLDAMRRALEQNVYG